MNSTTLNLARKWRSKNFDSLIGQELAVKLLKNSLYRNLVFPVYLFSGPKGSGKTSLARIFASSLNCQKLIDFQSNPQNINIPCQECTDCRSIQKLAHPDFIEIDAASNTGVENIRNIIETASFIPLSGKKKIYLIDEAHMLSKSAFNALLKILEEPPPATVFILATTDDHKIIETVKSRCFQIFFNPISINNIANHLETICKEEKINFEKEGLSIIAKESGGSLRDALNIIERVRLANTVINKNTVFQTLGFLDEDHFFELFDLIINQSSKEILLFCSKINLKQYNCQIIFKRLIELIRETLLIKVEAPNNLQNSAKERIETITKNCSIDHLIYLLDLCCNHELVLAKTTTPDLMLENLLIKLTQKKKINIEKINVDLNGDLKKDINSHRISQSPDKIEKKPDPLIKPEQINTQDLSTSTDSKNIKLSNTSPNWQNFLSQVESTNDPLILSIFKQALVEETAISTNNQISLTFNKDLAFFENWIESSKSTWKPIIDRCFNCDIKLLLTFNESVEKVNLRDQNKIDSTTTDTDSTSKASIFNSPRKKSFSSHSGKEKHMSFDISEIDKWKMANLLVKIFPGSRIYKMST